MTGPLAVDETGDVLAAFHAVAEDVACTDAPLPAALVALWHADRLLLVFNRQRRCWELPGGMIDPGETPRQAAIRELREESGLVAENLAFAGYARFALVAPPRTEYAALYTGRSAPRSGFTPNDEIGAVCWWDGVSPLTGRVSPLDLALARLARPSG
ncbi:NUDIX domain-containing protein [Amycolatopsis anabasis]|uniref:NUDIX domain-containing protein n=1 Tax=Amycolatopsis anabasis TaxID=1840409 RepID=UPI00131B3793|nr:NUDIX hydrolase [Amycolatopsis anabasis]